MLVLGLKIIINYILFSFCGRRENTQCAICDSHFAQGDIEHISIKHILKNMCYYIVNICSTY